MMERLRACLENAFELLSGNKQGKLSPLRAIILVALVLYLVTLAIGLFSLVKVKTDIAQLEPSDIETHRVLTSYKEYCYDLDLIDKSVSECAYLDSVDDYSKLMSDKTDYPVLDYPLYYKWYKSAAFIAKEHQYLYSDDEPPDSSGDHDISLVTHV